MATVAISVFTQNNWWVARQCKGPTDWSVFLSIFSALYVHLFCYGTGKKSCPCLFNPYRTITEAGLRLSTFRLRYAEYEPGMTGRDFVKEWKQTKQKGSVRMLLTALTCHYVKMWLVEAPDYQCSGKFASIHAQSMEYYLDYDLFLAWCLSALCSDPG